MGKRQHQKDKMYLTTTEWSNYYGGYKKSSHSGAQANFRRLPLFYCCLSLIEFNYPYCDPHGNIFDLEALLPFLNKYKRNPVTGKPFSEKHLVKLHFHKANTGEYHCPVLFKPFTGKSHVIAVKTTGNVFSYEAIEQLNLKTNNWRDLLNDEPFTKEDIIVLQDPYKVEKFNCASFYHIKNKLVVENEELVKSRSDASYRLKNVSHDTQVMLDEYKNTYIEPHTPEIKEKKTADKFNAAHYSTGAVAASFTSTTIDVETTHAAAVLADDVVRYSRVKEKGYVSLITNLGTLNLELYCNEVPKACENFLKLCEKGYYDGTIFHRSIKHFMLQGGDPEGTGKGGESYWGGSFKDVFKTKYSHKGRGVLSMANSGPDTNKSQFFITYRSCPHLDGKHMIFGKVVGGLDTLSTIESVGTDNKDKPVENIRIQRTIIFVDPFAKADDQLATERKKELEEKELLEDELKSRKKQKTENLSPKIYRAGIGKLLNLTKTKSVKTEGAKDKLSKEKANCSYGFKDFGAF